MKDNLLFEKYGHNIPAGTVLFQEGDEGNEMFIIQEGKIRISKSIGEKEHVIAILGKGDFFGEMALVNRIKRTATAQAVTDVRLLSFDRQGFRSMIEKNSKIAMNIIDKLCRRLQQANMQIQHLKRKNAGALIALNLYYAFESTSKELLSYEKTLEEISLSLETPLNEVEETVRKLEETEILKREGNGLRLLNLEGLKAMSETSPGKI
ncbi:MAG: Crp/Fnr family transcriptional regulator [Spirochaetales bacterium]|nr:Crp/Fnr family transcriptional regulator [Spirochaetales bacterium]